LLALKGQALQLVQGLPIAPENYSRVWNVLVESYENKKLIVATYVRQLLGLKSISTENVGEIIKVCKYILQQFKCTEGTKCTTAFVPTGCRTSGPDMSRVANQTGR
jgi:hypothetical protein